MIGQPPPSRWISIFASFAIMWYVAGLGLFIISLMATRAVMLESGMSPPQVDFILQAPLWAKLLNAGAIITGLLGAVALLLRRYPCFVLMLISVPLLLCVKMEAVFRGALGVFGTFEALTGWAELFMAIALLAVARQLRADNSLY